MATKGYGCWNDIVETDVSANLSTPTEPKDAVGGSSQIELTTSENAVKMEQAQCG